MSKFHLEEVSANYMVTMTIEEFMTLDSRSDDEYLDIICPTLEGLGAVSINYNGHFGPHVYFTTSEDADIIAEKIMHFTKKESWV